MKGGVVCFLLFVKLIFAQSYVIEWPFVEKKATYGVRIESKIDSRTLFFKFDGDPGYQYGDRVLIKGAIRACRKPRNLGMFDECKWWYRIGIDGQIDVDSHSLLSHSKKLPFLIFISNLPEQMFLRLQRNFASYAPFVYTVLFGNRIDYLETDIKHFFSEAGLIHLLVVSGAQISLLSMVVLSICKLFRAPFILSFFVILILQGFYLIIAGVDPSILRAIVMTDLILWHRYYSLIAFPFWWYLWVAAIIVICIIPKAVLFPGFWYSFTITFGLLYLLPKIVGNVFGPKKVINYILASFTAVFFALPIQLIQTQTIQPMSLISNLWATWLSSLILLSSAVVMIIEPIVPYITDIISSVVIMMIDVLIVLSKNIKPWIIAIPKPLNLCFSLVFILPLVMINFSRFKYFFLLITILFFMYSVHLIQKRQMLISLDVGQGDATLILDGFSSVLIDTGGLGQSQAMARTHILPVLRYYGINELDLVIITHHDLDHLGGLKDIIGYGVRQIYSPESLPYNHHLTLTSPLGLDLNSMKLNLFPVGYILPKLNSNNHGIVVSVDALRASFLITGDIDQETELRLIQVGFIDQHTFLKLGHHGSISSTSSELLDVVQPLFVWNSCGFNNRFGHPNPAVIDRLNYRNIPFLSTHESGAIFFDLNSKVMIRSALSNDSFKLKQGVGL